MPKWQKMMESNGDGSIFVGRGLSRDFQQDKERKNRTPDELVMAERKISRSQFLQVADVRKWRDVRSPNVHLGQKSANYSSG